MRISCKHHWFCDYSHQQKKPQKVIRFPTNACTQKRPQHKNAADFFFNVTIVFGKNKQKSWKKKANNRKTNTEKADLDLSNKY